MNIIHCHLNDYADFVTVESVYLKHFEEIKDHYNLDIDSTGMPLNYKIIVKDWTVVAVLYKRYVDSDVIELPF